LKQLEVFLDENRDSPKLVAPLEDLGFSVHRHVDSFRRGTSDEDWVPDVVRRGWVIVTTDRGRGDNIMLMVLERHLAVALIFSPKVHPVDCAKAIGTHQRRICQAIERYEPPLVLYVRESEVKAHDFNGGPKQSVLGNGTIKGDIAKTRRTS